MKPQQTSPLPLFDTLEYVDIRSLNAQHSTIFSADDHRFATEFLYSYRGNEATFNAYRREVERLLHWCWEVQRKSLKSIRHIDFEDYLSFCENPPQSWIGLKKVPRFVDQEGQRIPNPEWRPFVVTLSKTAHRLGTKPDPKNHILSQKAIREIFTVLSSFFNYLIQEAYVEHNPIAQIRQKSKYLRKHQTKAKIRRLSELQWAYVIETAELMAKENPKVHERTLFVMNALFGMYLRISELAASERWTPKMGDFFRDHDGSWWFTTVGKGNKERIISVSDAMLEALKRYRISRNLTPLPAQAEITALIPKTSGKGPITSTRHIRVIVQACFDAAINRMRQDNFNEEADQLLAATVHWLRHTGISEDVKHRPREHVRDDAGHSSSAITDKYIDIELRARHASAKKKLIKPDA